MPIIGFQNVSTISVRLLRSAFSSLGKAAPDLPPIQNKVNFIFCFLNQYRFEWQVFGMQDFWNSISVIQTLVT